MSFFDSIGSILGGKPGAPAQRPFRKDPFVGGKQFQGNLQMGENAYLNALMGYLGKEPGYDQATKDVMYDRPAEATKYGERAALRQQNQGAAFDGSYMGGSRQKGRGQILGQGMSTRANLRQNAIMAAAQAALTDRLNQLQAAGAYVNPRMGASMQHTGMRNNYSMGLNQLSMQQYQQDLAQHNLEYGQGMGMLTGFLGGL